MVTLTLFFILIACNAVSAAGDSNNTTQSNTPNHSSSILNTTDSASNVTISGEVKKCSDGNPFSGVTVTASKNGTKLASTTTGDDGIYTLSFISSDDVFNVTASYPLHNSSSKEVNVILGQNNTFYGTSDFRLGGNVWVDPVNGKDDSSHGTESNPFKTIAYAIKKVDKGGYIWLFSGTYAGTGNVNLTIDKNVTILRNGLSYHPIIDAEGNSRIFNIKEGVTVTIVGVTLKNGYAYVGDSSDKNDGGAIYNNGTLNVDQCTFTNNYAWSDGNAIYSNGNLNIINSNFENSKFASRGGAIYINDGTCNVTGCTFTSNSAIAGGAIYSCGTLNVVNCNFTKNTGRSGGAIYLKTANVVTITGSNFTNNQADVKGGAIYSFCVPFNVNSCTFTNNTAPSGGAIYNDYALNFNVINSNFTSNNATDGYGGAIYNNVTQSIFNVNSSNFINNSATIGGAIYSWNNYLFSVNGNNFTDNNATIGGAVYNGKDSTLNVTGSTFTGNSADNANANPGGGAIANVGTLTVEKSNFTNNSEINGDGGAIWNTGQSTINGCNFVNNTAESGAVWNTNGANCTILNCTFTNNSAINYGAAIENYGNMTVNKSTFTNGTSNNDGGAISNYGNSLTITNCNFNGNQAKNNGGAIWNTNTLTVTDSILTNNTAVFGGAIYTTSVNTLINFNRIFNNAGTDVYSSASGVNAIKNWWGSNFEGTNPQSANRVNGNVNADPWVILTVNANPTQIDLGGISTITADLNHINGGGLLTGGHVPDSSISLQIPWGDLNSGGLSINENTANGAITPVTFHANGATVNSVYNPVKVTASTDGYTTGDESAFITINTLTNLAITKTGPTTVTAGTKINYTITVTNNGRDYASNVVIRDMLHVNISNVTWNVVFSNGTNISGTGNIALNIGTLQVGDSCIITVNGTVLSSAANASVLTNTATVSTSTTETSDNDNSATTTTTVNTISDITLNETVDNTSYNVGDAVTFTVKVHNNGPSDAVSIQIHDLIPSGFKNVVITPSKGNYDNITGIWALNIANGENATLNLTSVVSSVLAGKNATNIASYGSNSVNATIYVPKSDLYINISSSNKNPKVGQVFTLTYKLGNNGPDNATNVKITIPLPSGFTVSSISGNGNWTYDSATNTVTWTLVNVPVGDPYLYISGWLNRAGTYKFDSSIYSDTYNLDAEGVTPLTINALNQVKAAIKTNKTTSNNSTETLGMQKTGVPLNYLILVVLMVIGGLIVPKRK